MARYYFHIEDGAHLIQDPEGSELATIEDARSQALKSARELWADAIKSGRSLAADAVVIADEQGSITFVPMAEALPTRRGYSNEAENLRSKAKRALRLAESLSDRYASQALAAHAETLLERAESLEQATAAATAGSAPEED
jgi:hypothetical protein